jgi:hypothetical protein
MNLREGTRRLALLLGFLGAIVGGFGAYFQLKTIMRQRAQQKGFQQLADSPIVQQERERLKPEFQYVRLPDKRWGKFRIDASIPAINAAIEKDFPGTFKHESTQTNPYAGIAIKDAPAPYEVVPAPPYSDIPADATNVKPVQAATVKPTKGRYTDADLAQPPATLPSDFNGWDIAPSVVNKDGIKVIGWNKDYVVAYVETEDGRTLYATQTPSAGTYLQVAVLPVLGFFIPWTAVRAIGWVVAGFAQHAKG